VLTINTLKPCKIQQAGTLRLFSYLQSCMVCINCVCGGFIYRHLCL